MNTYRTSFHAKCPTNDAYILYALTIESATLILVEDIVSFTLAVGSGYHEDIADRLHAKFRGCQILKAHHHGVDIETYRS